MCNRSIKNIAYKYAMACVTRCNVHTSQMPGTRFEEFWTGFKKYSITPFCWDRFTTGSNYPADIEKVTNVSGATFNVLYALASNLNSVCAVCNLNINKTAW